MGVLERYLIVGLFLVTTLAAYSLVGGFKLPGVTAAAEQPDGDDFPRQTITVRGTATVRVEPDRAAILLGVESQGDTALVAQQANSRVMNDIVDALKQAGVTEDALETTRFSIDPVYNNESRRDGAPPEVVGFRVSNLLRVETERLDELGKLIDVATAAGANRVQNVRFFIENKKEYEHEALKVAVEDARAKAEVMAAAAGSSLGRVLTMNESNASTYPPTADYAVAREAAEQTPIFSGDQALTVTVAVTFEHQ